MTTMPSHYQIRVKGHFDPTLAEWFAPLTGAVRDQAELYGILLKLSNLNFP